jgi:hypothetical protein
MLKPNKIRAKVIITFLVIALILDIAFIVSSYLQLNLLRSVQSGMIISISEANANDMRHALIAIVRGLVGIVCIVTFIMWFRRGYYNLHQRVSNLSHSEGWAAGAWFVPFLNLWRPVQIMSEMNRETQTLLVKEKLTEPNKRLGILIAVWWTVWLASGVFNVIIQSIYSGDRISPTLDELVGETYENLYTTYATIPAAILVILVIRSYSKMEDLLPLVDTTAAQRHVLSDSDLLDR